MALTIKQRLQNLAPRTIDPNKCTNKTSIYQEITKPPEKKRRFDYQRKQWPKYNLGNGQTFNDPIAASEYLLQREYGETFFFKQDCHDPIFIPAEFTSNQYCKRDSTTALVDFNIEQHVKRTLRNLQWIYHWVV